MMSTLLRALMLVTVTLTLSSVVAARCLSAADSVLVSTGTDGSLAPNDCEGCDKGDTYSDACMTASANSLALPPAIAGAHIEQSAIGFADIDGRRTTGNRDPPEPYPPKQIAIG